MPIFELSGPNGGTYQIEAPDEVSALAAFQQLHGAPKEGINPTNLARSAAQGVPIGGGLSDTIEAGLETALSYPVEPAMHALGMERPGQMLSDAGLSPSARFAKAKALQEAKTKGFESEHPYVDTAAKVAGGIGAFGGALKAVPRLAGPLGFEGTIPQMVGKGAVSGAGISAADAIARGEDPIKAAEFGATTGAAAGPIGRGIGKVASKVTGAFRPSPALQHEITTPVAGVDVPVPNVDPVAASKIEIARRGGAGEPAQRIIQAGDEGTAAALERAKGNIGGMIDPAATSGAVPPQTAAETVAAELRAQEAARFQTEQAAAQRAAAGTQELRAGMDTTAVPAAPPGSPPASVKAPTIHAESPLAAGEVLSTGIQRKAEEAAAARMTAYNAKAAIPGQYDRAALGASGNAIRKDLSSGPIQDQVRITSSTPKATEALELIDETIGGHPPQALPNAAAPLTQDKLPPLTGVEIEGVRQRLNQIYGDAKRAANAPGGNAGDLRAVGRVIDAFDTHISNVEAAGGFSGDAKALAAARDAARASHVTYKTTFEPRNPSDTVGKNIEKVVGKFDGQEAGHDQVVKMAYGADAEPGGTPAAQFAQRIKEIFGEKSKEWAAYKQGLVSHLTHNSDGSARPAVEAADRIEKFLNAPKGKILSQVALTGEDRAALASHAERLRASEPTPLNKADSVEAAIARITGRDGFPPASINEVVGTLFGNAAGKPSVNFQLVTRLKRDLTPEGFMAVQNGTWSKIIGEVEGKTNLSPKAIADNIEEFFDGSGSAVSKVLYPAEVRTEAMKLARAIRSHQPVPGTTNPSGTAPMISKIASKAAHGILPMVGMVHGGIPGAIVGAVADKGITSARNARAAKEAALLYYGRQPTIPTDPRLAKAAAIALRGAAQGQIGSSR